MNHPNIATIYSIEEFEDLTFIAMEYIEGNELKSLLNYTKSNAFSIEQAIKYAIQIAEGLTAAHRKGIVHRDIKSANIMITDHGNVKIMDFGLAKVWGGTLLTKIGTTVGTISYMSPEQARGKEVDQRTDIWSFGIVLFEMLTGKLPFRSEYEQAVIYSIMYERHESAVSLRPEIPPDLESIINKCLSKKVEDRYQDTDALIKNLSGLFSDIHVIGVKSKLKRKKNRNYLIMSISSVILSLIIIGYFFLKGSFKNHSAPDTRENTLAVMYFENQSGEKDIDKVLVNMLTTNLARYKDLNVISSQHLFDILKSLGKQDSSSINIDDATDVANYAKVDKIVTGSIIKMGARFRINVQLLNVESGKIINSYQEDGYKIEDIFLMVDDLTEKIQENFSMPNLETRSKPLKIQDVTTSSIDAYKYYEKGLEKLWRWEVDDAVQNFQKAINIDSTFAIAYLQLAVSETNNSLYVIAPFADINPKRELLSKADKYSFKASEKEKWLIQVNKNLFDRRFYSADSLAEKFVESYPDDREANQLYALTSWIIGSNDQCIKSAEHVLEIDPTFIGAYGMLGYLYSALGDNKHAISSIKKAIALQHADNDYDTAFEIYLQANQPEEALHLCETMEKSKGVPPYEYLAYIYTLEGRGDKSREEYEKEFKADPQSEWDANNGIACSFAYEGKYSKAAAEFNKCIGQAKLSKNFWLEMFSYFDQGKIFLAQGNKIAALESFSQVEKVSKKIFKSSFNPTFVISEYYCGLVYVRDSDFKNAALTGEKIKSLIKTNHLDPSYMDFYYLLAGEIYSAENNPRAATEAVSSLSPFTKMFPRRQILTAKVEALNGRTEKAIKILTKFRDAVSLKNRYMGGDNLDFLICRSQVNYNIAKLYDRNVQRKEAVEYYQKSLGEWKYADQNIPEVIDVKQRIQILKNL